LRENVAKNEVKLEYVAYKDQVVDIFMKDIPKDTFEYLWENLEIISHPYFN
jgi:hypothetical protein